MKSRYRSHYIGELDEGMNGKEVTLSGWVHEVRDIGSVIFLLLRDHTGIIQVTAKKGVVDEGIIKAMSMPKESVVMVKGMVKDNKIAKKGYEIIPTEIINLNPLSSNIPFETTGKVPADLDVRLDYRYIDLRRLETSAIFNIESTILGGFRECLMKEGFGEFRPPSLVKEATEGGAEVFKVNYFGETAYLAQSPQLYKQLAVIGGFDRVFCVTPVFRAEKSNTTYHLNEITQMDIEMGFADHDDAIDMLEYTIEEIIKGVQKKNKGDLEKLGVELKSAKVTEVEYKNAVKKLNENGHKMELGEDFNRDAEALLAKLYGNLLIVREYPTAVRAFYSMPNEKDPFYCHSYDFIYGGLEIASGAQRIHSAELLETALKSRGEDPKEFEFYINAFRQGAPPHAGWSIGLERLGMKISGKDNIKECAMFPRDRKRLVP